MKIIGFIALIVSFFNFVPIQIAHATCVPNYPTWSNAYCSPNIWGYDWESGQYNPAPDYAVAACNLVSQGYICTKVNSAGGSNPNGCGQFFPTPVYYNCAKDSFTYSATKNDPYTLTGTRTTDVQTITAYTGYSIFEKPSPFIYLRNAPEGDILISLDSDFDSYSPAPLFNQTNGWLVNSKDSVVSLAGNKIDHLFYELALKKITLNRNGINFTSKDEVISYLKKSDFLTKLGFSAEEKNNSLNYLVPKLQEIIDTEYYYLSILDTESIADTSTLKVTPEPNRIDRLYFVVYPTEVPVTTSGNFVFPEIKPEDGFTVKETGEFLINPGMFVFFR